MKKGRSRPDSRSHGNRPSGRGGRPEGSSHPRRSDGRSDSRRPDPRRSDGPRKFRGDDRRESNREMKTEDFSSVQGRWVIGVHSCEEVVKVRPHMVGEAFFRIGWQESTPLRDIAQVLESLEIPIRERSPEQLERIGSGHQGVALLVTEEPAIDWEALAEPGHRIIMILDGIEDPHNLGSMLRTGWLAGVSGILIPEDRAVSLTPSVCKVASGGAEHVAVEAHTNFGSVVKRLKDIGFWVYGLSEKGKSRPWDFKLPEKVVWVIGNEGSGMRLPTERLCDELVRLPQVSTGSSYNASIAAAMALSETCRQFGKPE